MQRGGRSEHLSPAMKGDDLLKKCARVLHKELLELQAESDRLMETISKNWEEMGL